QAEDGIRDFHVTGVQTCALPILRTEQAEATTTEGLTVLKKMLAECYNLRNELKRKVKAAKARLIYSQVLFVFSRILLVGFFIRALRSYRDRTKEYYDDLLYYH